MKQIKKKKKKNMNQFELISYKVAQGVGTVKSLLIHTFLFLSSFIFIFFGFNPDRILLIVTTIVSLEAIYLSLFIQMAVNVQTKHIEDVKKDIDEIQEDIEDIQEESELEKK